MPALGIDPRTGELIVLEDPPSLPSTTEVEFWGPSRVRKFRQLEEARWQEEEQKRAEEQYQKLQEYHAANAAEYFQRRYEYEKFREEYEGKLKGEEDIPKTRHEIAVSLLRHPYTSLVLLETGVSAEAVISQPSIFSSVVQAAFLKYQQDLKRSWQEGKGPYRPLTAQEFLETIPAYKALKDVKYDLENYDEPRDPDEEEGAEQEAEQDGPPSKYWIPTYGDYFTWADQEAWWLEDPDYRAYIEPMQAPPGFQKVENGVYEDPQTGFFYFFDTGAFLGHGFLGRWQENRDLGKPVTNEFSFNGKTYQVFENGILSYDPNTGEIKSYQSVEEAGLSPSAVESVRTVPRLWASTGEEIPIVPGQEKEEEEEKDPYIGTGSAYYDANPAVFRQPSGPPSATPYFGYRDAYTTWSGVWVRQGSMTQRPDYWVHERFIRDLKSADEETRKWYSSLSEHEKNQVFANYIMTGQIYL